MAVTSFSEADIQWLEAHGAKKMHYFSGQKYYEIKIGRNIISIEIMNGKYWCSINQMDLYEIPFRSGVNMQIAIRSAIKRFNESIHQIIDSQKQINEKLDDLFKEKKNNDH